MCFSTEASFGASAIILTIGAVCINKSVGLPQRVLSCIPIVFGIQQFAEGIVWLTLSHPGLTPWDKISTYAFLIFAEVVWPLLVPLAVWLLETNNRKKKILSFFLLSGAILSCVLGITLLVLPVQSSVSCYHIVYNIQYPQYLKHLGIFYF